MTVEAPAHMRGQDGDFPPELWDMVIDHLHDSPTSLKSCSLVCKAWTENSRHHLFWTVCDSGAVRDSPTALASFLSATPDVAVHVRSLMITNRPAMSISALRSVLRCLPRLGIFQLSSSAIVDDTPADQAVAAGQVPSTMHPMRIVQITECTLSENTLYRILGCFQIIVCLDLQKLEMAASTEPALVPLTVYVAELTLIRLPISMVVGLLRSLNSAILFTLKLLGCVETWTEADRLGELLPTMPSLSLLSFMPYLYVAPCGELSDRPIWERLRLRECNFLRSIAFILPPTPDPAELWTYIYIYLTSLPYIPPDVKQIRLLLNDRPDLSQPDLLLDEWKKADAMLMDSRQDLRIFVDTGRVAPAYGGEDFVALESFLMVRLREAFKERRVAVMQSLNAMLLM